MLLPVRRKCPIVFRMDERIGRLSAQLFWDVDQSLVDAGKNGRWLVERVLQRGTWEDWLILREIYGKKELERLSVTLRVDPKSANFLRLYCLS